jgi:hypothetical protein
MSETTTRPLKVGLMLPTNEGWMAGGMARWSDLKTMAQHAEAAGFDSLWLADHLLFELGEPHDPPRGVWEAWSVLSALAAVTTGQLSALYNANLPQKLLFHHLWVKCLRRGISCRPGWVRSRQLSGDYGRSRHRPRRVRPQSVAHKARCFGHPISRFASAR